MGKKHQSSASKASQASQKSQSGRRKHLSQGSDTLFDESCDELELSDHDRLRLRQRLTVLLQVLLMLKYIEHIN